MDFETALEEFGKVLGNLKRAYAEEFDYNSSSLQILINESDFVTIFPTNETGKYIDCFRKWLNTDIEE